LRVVGVGIDIVDLAVFRRRLETQDGLAEELFFPSEIEYCAARARPWESYAARFAAKEAVFKALGRGLSHGLRWKQVEVLREESGAVGLRLMDSALAAAGELGVGILQLSMSHSGENAIAIVIALADPPPAAAPDRAGRTAGA
jgi:holo-[acyl-carrier protein] synthase